MENRIVRVKRITIESLKNVKRGTLLFENSKNNSKSSIVGLYGQNGSGKTALIDAISILQIILRGAAIPERFANYISADSQSSTLKFEFEIYNSSRTEIYTICYSFSLEKEELSDLMDGEDNSFKIVVFNEIIHYSYRGNDRTQRKTELINTNISAIFGPKTKYDIFTNQNKESDLDLIVAKKVAYASSKSFIFSADFLKIIKENCHNKEYLFILNSLVSFGKNELFIIDTQNSGLISLNVLPVSFKIKEGSKGAIGKIPIALNGTTAIPMDLLHIVKKMMSNMNIVLSQIIPNLTISITELGTKIMKDNSECCMIQLMSNRNGFEIPLQYESEGIKKIVSILNLLIAVYNTHSVTVAIDELDSGIFEYLLGEILSIISEKGKGQLIFTSHNLRPLETIDKRFIAFTTVNPGNRYIRMNNIKSNNNLRDMYYRDILLGGQNELLYDATNNSAIAYAFMEAGEEVGS